MVATQCCLHQQPPPLLNLWFCTAMICTVSQLGLHVSVCVNSRPPPPGSYSLRSICLAILEWDICLLPCHRACALLMSRESWQALPRHDCGWARQPPLRAAQLAQPAPPLAFIVCINMENSITLCVPTVDVLAVFLMIRFDDKIGNNPTHWWGEGTISQRVVVDIVLQKET